jgi:hypothetical protein
MKNSSTVRACASANTPKLLSRNAPSVRRQESNYPSAARAVLAGRCKVKHLHSSTHLHAHVRGEKLIISMNFRWQPTNLLHERHLSTDLCTGFVDNLEL